MATVDWLQRRSPGPQGRQGVAPPARAGKACNPSPALSFLLSTLTIDRSGSRTYSKPQTGTALRRRARNVFFAAGHGTAVSTAAALLAPFTGLSPPKRSGAGSSPGLPAPGIRTRHAPLFLLSREPASAGFASVGKPAEAGYGDCRNTGVFPPEGPGLKALAWTRLRCAAAEKAPSMGLSPGSAKVDTGGC